MMTGIKSANWVAIVIGHVTKCSFKSFSHGLPSPGQCEQPLMESMDFWHPSKFCYEIVHVHLNTDLNNC